MLTCLNSKIQRILNKEITKYDHVNVKFINIYDHISINLIMKVFMMLKKKLKVICNI